MTSLKEIIRPICLISVTRPATASHRYVSFECNDFHAFSFPGFVEVQAKHVIIIEYFNKSLDGSEYDANDYNRVDAPARFPSSKKLLTAIDLTPLMNS